MLIPASIAFEVSFASILRIYKFPYKLGLEFTGLKRALPPKDGDTVLPWQKF
jgi:hypothetical protein